MKESRLKDVCEGIFEYLEDGIEIQENQVYVLQSEIYKIIKRDDRKTLPGIYYSLKNKVKEIWNYKDLGSYSNEEIFLLGSIWNCIIMLEQASDVEKEEKAIEIIARNLIDQQKLLQTIENHPEFTHKDVAIKMHTTPSNLTQLMQKMYKEDLISDSRVGREKYYYLTQRGKKVLSVIRKNVDEHKKKNKNSNLFYLDGVVVEVNKYNIDIPIFNKRIDISNNENNRHNYWTVMGKSIEGENNSWQTIKTRMNNSFLKNCVAIREGK